MPGSPGLWEEPLRPRTEVLLAAAALAGVGVIAAALGQRQNRTPSRDPRHSIFLAGPAGSRGLADALRRLGVRVLPWRQRLEGLGRDTLPTGERVLFAELDPVYALDGTEAESLVEFAAGTGDLLLAGEGSLAAMHCYGYGIDRRSGDTVSLFRPGGRPGAVVTHALDRVLAARTDTAVVDSSQVHAGRTSICVVAEPEVVDTLLVTAGGRVAALRLTFDSGATHVTLVAPGDLFSNQRLRSDGDGVVPLRLLAQGYDAVWVDEYNQGFAAGGNLLGAVLGWSRRSPVGWIFWQLILVGLLALAATAVRFGPVLPRPAPSRRAASEHVHALAAALAAAQGSDVAVELMVRGLRRRLAPAGTAPAAAGREWLTRLRDHARHPRARRAVDLLLTLTRGRPDGNDVLAAANAVEDVWEDLTPSRPTPSGARASAPAPS